MPAVANKITMLHPTPEDLAAQEFEENPEVSVDTVFHRFDGRITAEQLLLIKERVQSRISLGYMPSQGTGLKEQPAVTTDKKKGYVPSTTEERTEWLRKWASERPLALTREARQALYNQFGMGLGTDTMIRIMREAKEKWKDPGAREPGAPMLPIPPTDSQPEPMAPPGHRQEAPSQEEVTKIAHQMLRLGLKRIELVSGPDGHLGIDWETFRVVF